MRPNLILDTDSYKASHYRQYPPKTQALYAYLESRGGRYDSTVFFGLQYLLDEYLSRGVSMKDVDEAAVFMKMHGEPFPYDQWVRVARKGYIPLRIRAVLEGTVVPTGNVLMTVESTDPDCFWMVTWLETMLMRLWYPITVATQSREIKELMARYTQVSSDEPAGSLRFKLHDFGARGVSSRESAGIGGMAHLLNFQGSDTIEGVRFANYYYGAHMAGYSVPAAEHSTITTWGAEGEVAAFRNMLTAFPESPIVCVVSDSYDLERAVTQYWGAQLKDEVIASGKCITVRPDSGDPVQTACRTVVNLEKAYGSTRNTKGFKLLNRVRVLQGDGVDSDSIEKILDILVNAGYSADNINFGMGGALLQKVDRDTQKFAYKTSAVKIDGVWQGVQKQPVTDPGKWSKRGFLRLLRNVDNTYDTLATMIENEVPGDLLVPVFENGMLLKTQSFVSIRDRAKIVLDNGVRV
jgi:nicotinamide phosphoribosyltransferase